MKNLSENNKENKFFVFELSSVNFKKILTLIVAVLFIQWALNRHETVVSFIKVLISVFSPIIIGFCIAFIINILLNPAEKLWEKMFEKKTNKLRKFKRPVCLILSTMIVGGLLFSLMFMVIPIFRDTLKTFTDSLPLYINNLESFLNNVAKWLESYGYEIPELNLNADKIIQQVSDFFAKNGYNLFGKTLGITTSIFTGIVDFLLAFAFSMYMLAFKERLCSFIKKSLYAFVPGNKAKKTEKLVSFIGRTFTGFITGQLTEAVIIGVLCCIGMLIFRIPYAPVISVLIAVTALIPVVGAFIGTGIGAFLILLVSPVKALWFIIFIVILQQIETNLIYPKVVGKSVGLPGILVLASVTVAGGLFGMIGMLISVPVCSILYTILREFINKKISDKKI